MALTRAGKKREAESPQGSSRDAMQETKKRKKHTRRTEAVNKAVDTAAGDTVQNKKAPKGLLDMPAEIRNHIYGYAVESEFEGSWTDPVPLVLARGQEQWPLNSGKPSARKFFGLTQVCKQLRTEYRPIWLLNSSVRLMQRDIRLYIHTFYDCAPKWESLPKLLQISAKGPSRGEIVVDLSMLFEIRACSSRTKIEFIPHILTEEDGPWNDLCVDCEANAEILGYENDMFMDCEHGHQNFEDFVEFTLEEQFPYFAGLNAFLENDNPRWLSDIRIRKVSLVRIDFAPFAAPDVLIYLSSNAKVVRKTRTMTSLRDFVNQYCKDRGLLFRHYELRFQLVTAVSMEL